MKKLGLTLLSLGFLAGAYVATLTPENRVDWVWFVPAFVATVAGVTLARMAGRKVSQQTGQLSNDVRTLATSLDRIVENIERLERDKATTDIYDLHGRIDELFVKDLADFVGARKSLMHVYDVQAYANVMNEFTAGERYLNRIWSCSVDGYIDEAHDYLTRSRKQFVAARGKLRELEARGS